MGSIARVVPNVPSFSVDDGFRYAIPDRLAEDVTVGSIVRVPLSGRRVRGWVTAIDQGDTEALKELLAVSGSTGVFDSALLDGLEWAAHHYVAPLSVLLAQATPPNLPKSTGSAWPLHRGEETGHPLHEVASQVAEGKKQPARAIVDDWRDMEWLPGVVPVLEAGKSVAVIVATAAEAGLVAGAWPGDSVLVAGGSDADATAAWEEAQTPGKLVIGTPRIATWMMAGLSLVIVLEEGRRAMKERQTPTIHVRDLIRKRALLEGFATVFLGPTPSVEVLAAGAEVTRTDNRAWGLVEVVDRSEDAPGSGFISERVLSALRGSVEAGRRAFVYTHRRIGAASMRCTRCRTVRQCRRCGTRVGRVDRCPRCSAVLGPCVDCGAQEFEEMGTIPDRLVGEIKGRLGSDVAGVYPEGDSIWVGTERDLASLPPVDLVVASDVDGMLMGHSYRASEEALRQLARLANSLEAGSGRRMMLQTSHPESDLITTLKRGDPIPYLERVLAERARVGAPPSAELIAVEVRGGDEVDLAEILESGSGYDLLGPLGVDGGLRWLIQGDLTRVRRDLRNAVGRLRESGVTVRVDADPIDL